MYNMVHYTYTRAGRPSPIFAVAGVTSTPVVAVGFFFPAGGAVRFYGRPLGVWAALVPAVYLLSAMRNGGAQFIIDK